MPFARRDDTPTLSDRALNAKAAHLEAGVRGVGAMVRLLVAGCQHLHNAPGRKTDVSDSA
jgi:hypothetical protein